jgi:hypothetical protein
MGEVLIVRSNVAPAQLDDRLRSHFSANYGGVSTGPYGVRVHFDGAPSTADSTWANTIVNAHRSLELSVDQAIITADGVDTATITCADSAIALDSNVTYTVWLDGEVFTEPATAAVTSGEVQLTLTTEEAGLYRVEIARQGAGNYETGEIFITANP